MSSRVNNGRRVAVEHDAYTGQAGMIDRTEGRAQIAFVIAKPEFAKKKFTGAIAIEGEPWTIEAAEPSRTASQTMIVLKVARGVTAVSDGEAEA